MKKIICCLFVTMLCGCVFEEIAQENRKIAEKRNMIPNDIFSVETSSNFYIKTPTWEIEIPEEHIDFKYNAETIYPIIDFDGNRFPYQECYPGGSWESSCGYYYTNNSVKKDLTRSQRLNLTDEGFKDAKDAFVKNIYPYMETKNYKCVVENGNCRYENGKLYLEFEKDFIKELESKSTQSKYFHYCKTIDGPEIKFSLYPEDIDRIKLGLSKYYDNVEIEISSYRLNFYFCTQYRVGKSNRNVKKVILTPSIYFNYKYKLKEKKGAITTTLNEIKKYSKKYIEEREKERREIEKQEAEEWAERERFMKKYRENISTCLSWYRILTTTHAYTKEESEYLQSIFAQFENNNCASYIIQYQQDISGISNYY